MISLVARLAGSGQYVTANKNYINVKDKLLYSVDSNLVAIKYPII
jgi:hypothetical protein